MSASRRSILAAAGGGLASLSLGGPTRAADDTIRELFEVSHQSNAALMRGDIERYFSLVTYSDDFSLMSPFGGKPSQGGNYSRARREALGRFFRNGTLQTELIHGCASDDLVALALIERPHVEVGGLPAQDWALRVTLVYRREGAQWRLAHRHADPLGPGISLEEAATLSRRKVA